ncbi:MAG: hypothetical protein LKG81_09360, partial [Acetobacter peroxydans]|nr:hypothetical protein [Acetobacter peroxydans]
VTPTGRRTRTLVTLAGKHAQRPTGPLRTLLLREPAPEPQTTRPCAGACRGTIAQAQAARHNSAHAYFSPRF